MILSGLAVLSMCIFCFGIEEMVCILLVSSFFFLKVLCWEFESESGGFFSVDMGGGMLVVLSVFILVCMCLSGFGVVHFNELKVVLGVIGIMLVVAFSASSGFLFYFCFESVLIPIGMMILGWGYQPERLQAVNYLVVYTVGGSMPLIYGLSLFYKGGVSSFVMSMSVGLSNNSLMSGEVFLSAFLVKLAVFPLHLWLPKAHVEAPVFGSMILAGLLLKLGGFGLFRFMGVLGVAWGSCVVIGVLILSAYGGVLLSFVCLRQADLKKLIAYSSVVHMSGVLFGLLSGVGLGMASGFLIMVGHGLCSSGLFYLVNCMSLSSNSRLVCLNKGFLLVCPSMSFFCFLLCISNMAAPPSLNLFGELLMFMVSAGFSSVLLVLFGAMSFMSGSYSLFFYVSSQHGKSGVGWVSVKSLSFCDTMLLSMHLVPLSVLFMFYP
uniref:NADH-ubiquinone oxidoreductase chain 4 n=1 Tax=Modiolus modiolus TaxID=40256 RepID=A0A1L7H863_MODMO|nr:NADH dehydrogenase subunit 4 [Modiolus modiolus]